MRTPGGGRLKTRRCSAVAMPECKGRTWMMSARITAAAAAAAAAAAVRGGERRREREKREKEKRNQEGEIKRT